MEKKKLTKIKINNIEINYLKLGHGPQTLLLMPGTLGFIDSFKELTDIIDQEKYTLIVWEPPGYGLSRPPDRDFSPGFLHRDADHVISLMKMLQIDKYALLGYCSGGATALIVASKAGKQVEKLIVWNCNVYITEKEIEYYETTRDIENWPEYRRQKNVEKYGVKYFSEIWSAWVDSCQTILRENDGNICREVLSAINVPTLILHGAQDRFIPVEHADYLHRNIKNSLLEIHPAGTHAMHIMLLEWFYSTVDNFLTSYN